MEAIVGLEIEPVDHPRRVMEKADVILAATSSIEPVIRGEWLEPGMHVTAINNCADREAIARIGLFARTGGGQPQNFYCGEVRVGNRLTVESVPTVDLSVTVALGDLILSRVPGRTSDEQITSFGLTGGEGGRGIQFAAAGAYVYQAARTKGIGRQIELEWF
jgi:ornithine cyclodeaminase/alanine dehydrogenase-like protein (mu-crystallin family)